VKRRGFLTMLGAATLAPALPAVSAPAAATYNRYMYGLAVFHARTRAHVSAAGIAYRLKVTTAQAEAMMVEMTAKGMITPVAGKPGAMRATSNILKGGVWDTAEVKKAAQKRETLQGEPAEVQTAPKDWIAHLQQICRDQGMSLSERCFA